MKSINNGKHLMGKKHNTGRSNNAYKIRNEIKKKKNNQYNI